MKNRFFGKYYKFIANDGFSFALIMASSNEGESIQLITKDSSFNIINLNQVKYIDHNKFVLDIEQENISFKGTIYLGELHPLKKKVMGPFTYIPFMECKHNVYSMFNELNGEIICNGIKHSFKNGIGYIEGDQGRNFPSKYIWYNSILPSNKGITLAIASIPFGLFSFIGVLCFIKTNDKEYYLCTWNNVKIKQIQKSNIVLKKGKYQLKITILDDAGHLLAAPVKGSMNRYIKENISVKSKYEFTYKDEIILSEEDDFSSCEWMWNHQE